MNTINRQAALFLLVVITFFAFRFIGLKSDMTNSDAIRWHERSENFINAFVNGNYKDTYQKYHPGVTLMWIVGTTKYFLGEFRVLGMGTHVTYDNKDWYETVDFVSKLSVLATITLLFSVSLNIIYKLYGAKIAILFGFMVAVEPYLIGIDRWLHLTSLETYLCLTSFLVILYKQKIGYLVGSAFLLSLAILTKISALFILPVILFIVLKRNSVKHTFLYLTLISIFIFIFFPALWVEPIATLAKILSASGSAIDGSLRSENSLTSYSFYFVVLAIKTSVVTIVLLLVALKNSFRNKLTGSKYLVIYFCLIFVGLTSSGQKIDRYVVTLLPILLLFIAVNINNWRSIAIAKSIETLLVLVIFFPIMSGYFIYTPKSFEFIKNMGFYDNSGEYYRDAAVYLNNKNSKVFVPDNFDTFNPYYKGIYGMSYTNSDYVVTSYDVDRKNAYIEGCTIEKAFGSKTYVSVFVFKCN